MRSSHLRVVSIPGVAMTLLTLAAPGCRMPPGPAHRPPGPPPLERLAPCTGSVPPDTVHWQAVDDPVLELRLPPAYAEVAGHPMDSHARQFTTPDGRQRVAFDYGQWSSSLGEARGLPEFAECRAEIGGRPARVVTARLEGGRFFAGATWRDVRPGAHLTVSGTATTRAGREEVIAALRTVRLKVP